MRPMPRTSAFDPRPAAAAPPTALHENRIPEAEALLRAHLKRAPTDVAAIRMLAEVAARLGRNDDAEHLLERCLELAPSFHAARQNYALVLHRGNKPDEALAEIEALLASDPANPGYRNLKAVVLCRIGDYDAGDRALRRASCANTRTNAKLWLSYGHALKTAGLQARAIAAYRQRIALDPGFGEAWWSLANLKTFRFDADDVRRCARSCAQRPRRRSIATTSNSRSARRWRTRATTPRPSRTTSAATRCARDVPLQRRRTPPRACAGDAHLHPRILRATRRHRQRRAAIRSSSSACRARARR